MPPFLVPVLLAAGAAWFMSSLAPTPSKPPVARRRHRGPVVRNHQRGFESEADVALYAVRSFLEIFKPETPPDVHFTHSAVAHYDPNSHAVCINLQWVRQTMHRLCTDDVCAYHVIIAVVAHEMRHSMQEHTAFDTLATRRQHEDDADFAIGVVMAHLGLDPAQVNRLMRHLGGPGHTEHSPGPRRAELVWRGYYAARGY